MDRILVEEGRGVVTVTLNRKEALNALDKKSFDDLFQLFLELEQREDIARVIMQGSGGNFCAGADVKEMYTMDSLQLHSYIQYGQIVMEKLALLPQMTIAAVEGFCVGGGLELALACDFIFAAKDATLQMPEAKLKLMPGFGGTQRLPARIGTAKAKRMLFTGEKFPVEKGLVDEVTEPGKAFEAAVNFKIDATFESISGIKKAISGGYREERNMFFRCFNTEAAQNALKAFVERRARV